MPKNAEAFDINKLIYDINYKKLHLPNKLGLFLHKAAQRHREKHTNTNGSTKTNTYNHLP